MPIAVDADQRLRDIAEATTRVAARGGTRAITIRGVADELGGSTTVITNYLRTRSDLLLNVMQHARARWKSEFDELAQGLSGAELFRTLATWSCTTTDIEQTVREIGASLAGEVEDGSDAQAAVQEDGIEHREDLLSALRAADAADPEVGADLMYLALRGFYFESAMDPERWDEARAQRTIRHLCDLLLGAKDGPG